MNLSTNKTILITGTYRVVSAVRMSGTVDIPATYNGKSVTEIDDRAFERTNITSITIPSSVTRSGYRIFNGWTASQKVNVPFASQAAADNAWGSDWRLGCEATIVYQP